jgi:hypothetical protein
MEAEVVESETEEAETLAATPKKSKVKSKPKAPEYLHALMEGAKLDEFKEFAKHKNPTSRPTRYLAATYWLKEHGGTRRSLRTRFTPVLRMQPGQRISMIGVRHSTAWFMRKTCAR